MLKLKNSGKTKKEQEVLKILINDKKNKSNFSKIKYTS